MGRNKAHKSREEKRQQKNQSWKLYQSNRSRAQFVSDCLLLTATEQHRQATIFYHQLKDKYPQKRDVRKTDEFRAWQRNQLRPVQSTSTSQDSTRIEKEKVLHIPLISVQTKTKEIPDLAQQTPEDLVTLDLIPSAVMDKLMEEIRADPVLNDIMNDFDFEEEVLAEGTVPQSIYEELDVGVDIEIDDRLQQEIDSIVHF